MSMLLKVKAGAALLGAFAGLSMAAPAQAITLFQTYNTGVNNAGLVQAAGTADSHYTIVATNNPNLVIGSGVTPTTTFKSDSWSKNSPVGTAGSAWISPFVNSSTGEVRTSHPYGGPPGTTYFYDYVTTFNVLSGFGVNDVFLRGIVQSDNYVQVFLNSALIPLVSQPDSGRPGVASNFQKFTAFGSDAGFQTGTNTLRFRVYDRGVVTGLRVDGLVAGAVPEPGVWAMLIVGFGLVAGQIRRRRRVAPMAIA
jgi:hypothetical protein